MPAARKRAASRTGVLGCTPGNIATSTGAIVDALAGRWGARAALTTRPGGGTRAELRFPAAGAPAPVPARDAATVTP